MIERRQIIEEGEEESPKDEALEKYVNNQKEEGEQKSSKIEDPERQVNENVQEKRLGSTKEEDKKEKEQRDEIVSYVSGEFYVSIELLTRRNVYLNY